MFGKNTLKDEVKALQTRLEALEHSEFDKQIVELKGADQRIDRAHQDAMDKMQKANHKLALRLSRLQGIAITLLAVLSGIALYYFSLYQSETKNRPVYDDVLVDMFQNRLDHAINRISLLNPRDEDRRMIRELNETRDQWEKVVGGNKRFVDLSELTQVLRQLVIERKAEDARNLLLSKMLTSNSNDFVMSRALLMQAFSLHTDGLCTDPDPTLDLIKKALDRDSGIVAAINLRGICLAQKSGDLLAQGREALEKKPEWWVEGVNDMKNSLLDNQFAYEFNPSQPGKIRYLNNKVFNSAVFLAAAVKLSDQRISEALKQLGEYEDIEAFYKNALREMTECYLLAQDRGAYLETEAELHALRLVYYTAKADNERAAKAREMMIAKLTEAINNNLLSTRGKNTVEDGMKYFTDDPLLKPLFVDPENYGTIDPKIKAAIEKRFKS